jgi:hypothetical protein
MVLKKTTNVRMYLRVSYFLADSVETKLGKDLAC